MNRKGFLLGEYTLKVVIAVLSILILVFLLTTIYNTFTSKNNILQAKSTIEMVQGLISEANLKGQSYGLLTEPQGWVLKYYSLGNVANCEGKKCICVCQNEGYFSSVDSNCNNPNYGYCEKSDSNIINLNIIEIKTKGINVKKEGESISITLSGN
jgi:hypothetical protein